MAEQQKLVMVDKMSDDYESFFLDEALADIIFVVGEKKFPAHKTILSARSPYFRNFFASEDNRNRKELPAQEKNPDVFLRVLKYIYGGRMAFVDLPEVQILDLLILALKYGMAEVEIPITDHLKSIINPENFCTIFTITHLFSLTKLFDFCLDYADRNAKYILGSSPFSLLPLDVAQILVRRDTLHLPEIDVFNAVYLWCKANYGVDAGTLLSEIRLHRICYDDLLRVVRPSKFFSADTILDAMNERPLVDKLKNVHRMPVDTNFATTEFAATITTGAASDKYFDKPADQLLASHSMEENPQGIVFKLGSAFTVNAIRMRLPDSNINETYSYYVEVSSDENQWTRIIDYTMYFCSGWQNLHFQPQVVRYIRISGTRATQGNEFRILNFEICFSSSSLPAENGVIVPTANVALLDLGARVIEGTNTNMLNGISANTTYTYHGIDAGAIKVRFPQPYILNSMRCHLYDANGYTFSYFVDVSMDGLNWTTVIDKQNEVCSGWQDLDFARQPVGFIRFTGTACSKNKYFYILQLECPAANTVH